MLFKFAKPEIWIKYILLIYVNRKSIYNLLIGLIIFKIRISICITFSGHIKRIDSPLCTSLLKFDKE